MALRIEDKRVVWTTGTEIYPIPTVVLVLSVAVVSYLVSRLADVLDVRPIGLPALWPENAVRVAVSSPLPSSSD